MHAYSEEDLNRSPPKNFAPRRKTITLDSKTAHKRLSRSLPNFGDQCKISPTFDRPRATSPVELPTRINSPDESHCRPFNTSPLRSIPSISHKIQTSPRVVQYESQRVMAPALDDSHRVMAPALDSSFSSAPRRAPALGPAQSWGGMERNDKAAQIAMKWKSQSSQMVEMKHELEMLRMQNTNLKQTLTLERMQSRITQLERRTGIRASFDRHLVRNNFDEDRFTRRSLGSLTRVRPRFPRSAEGGRRPTSSWGRRALPRGVPPPPNHPHPRSIHPPIRGRSPLTVVLTLTSVELSFPMRCAMIVRVTAGNDCAPMITQVCKQDFQPRKTDTSEKVTANPAFKRKSFVLRLHKLSPVTSSKLILRLFSVSPEQARTVVGVGILPLGAAAHTITIGSDFKAKIILRRPPGEIMSECTGHACINLATLKTNPGGGSGTARELDTQLFQQEHGKQKQIKTVLPTREKTKET